jgi:hypothetical protein
MNDADAFSSLLIGALVVVVLIVLLGLVEQHEEFIACFVVIVERGSSSSVEGVYRVKAESVFSPPWFVAKSDGAARSELNGLTTQAVCCTILHQLNHNKQTLSKL